MIYPLTVANEDDRRRLSEFGNGGLWKVCKYLEVKQDCTIGNHKHEKKDELFLLSKGNAEVTLNGMNVKVHAPVIISVVRGVHHTFNIKKGSILICLASEEHDDNDDIR